VSLALSDTTEEAEEMLIADIVKDVDTLEVVLKKTGPTRFNFIFIAPSTRSKGYDVDARAKGDAF
jgi:hypothetical protein